MNMRVAAILLALLSLLAPAAIAKREGLYCGSKNCYDVLGVKEKAPTTQIITSYRKLAREWHPDKNQHRLEEAERIFADIAHAYDILRNNESRRDYDYALRHPEEFAYNHARYYYRQYFTSNVQFNPFVVLFLGLLAWSGFDYFSRSLSHRRAVRRFQQSMEYKLNLKRLKEQKLLEMERNGEIKKKMNGKRTRKEIDAVEVDEQVLVDQIQVHGSYRKPCVYELAIVQFWLLPYHLVTSVSWQLRWFMRYSIRKEEYTQEDKEYLTRSILLISARTWTALDSKRKDKMLEQELWIPENEARFREGQRKANLAERAGYSDFDPD